MPGSGDSAVTHQRKKNMATTEQAAKPKRKPARRNKPGPKPGAKAAREAAAANGGTSDPAAKPPAQKLDQGTPKGFKFAMNQQVTIAQSGEIGLVRARAEWFTGNVSYFVAYTTKTGEFKESWIDEDLLESFTERRRRAK
jgi:hypothetical protein